MPFDKLGQDWTTLARRARASTIKDEKMNSAKIILGLFCTLVLNACVMLSSSDVTVKTLSKPEKGPKVVTFLNATPYIADMSVALAENGFTVMPMPTQQEITELQARGRVARYNEASTRWGISIMTQYSGMTCAFTDFEIHHFTLMLTDIATNEVVMVLKQKGSDGPCTTVKPVFGTLAESLSKNWM